MPRHQDAVGRRRLPASEGQPAEQTSAEHVPAPVSTPALAGLALGTAPAAGPPASGTAPAAGPPASGAPLAALRRHSETFRRRAIDLGDGKSIVTEELKAKELRRLQQLYPKSAEAIQAALDAGEYRVTRARKKHNLSDGESEEDEAVYSPSDRSYFRSLREEEEPEIGGLRPPVGHDPSISARAHVTAGSKAKVKSKYVSASHSMRVSGAWGASDGSRVAKFQVPPDADFHDLMDEEVQEQVGLKGTGLNAAKSSQEVLVGDGVPPEYVQAIYSAERTSVADYQGAGGAGASGSDFRFRSRTVVDKPPHPVKMRKVYDREEASEKRLQKARDYWDAEVANIVEQVNAQFADGDGFEPVDASEVAEYLTDHLPAEERTEDPYTLDYISNDEEYDS